MYGRRTVRVLLLLRTHAMEGVIGIYLARAFPSLDLPKIWTEIPQD